MSKRISDYYFRCRCGFLRGRNAVWPCDRCRAPASVKFELMWRELHERDVLPQGDRE